MKEQMKTVSRVKRSATRRHFYPPLRSSVPAHRDNAREPSGPFLEGSLAFLTAATRPRTADRDAASRP
jgi:hypothetical protein